MSLQVEYPKLNPLTRLKHAEGFPRDKNLPGRKLTVFVIPAGRSNAEIDILDSAEVYEPSTGKWTLTNPMVDARYVFQLVTLANSSVMALGGTGSAGYTAAAEIFNSS